ncbi:MAG: hypothetical protein OHK0023_00750 [Anaerolineae bacterium]
MVLTVWGHKPLPFPDGKTAWAWLDSVENGSFQGELPEFALMDIKMPGYTGDEIAARIRRTDKIKDIPVVLMTAYSLSESEINEMRSRVGFDNLINKPLPELERLQRLLYDVRDKRLAAKKASGVPLDLKPTEPLTASGPDAPKDGADQPKPVQASTAAEVKKTKTPSVPPQAADQTASTEKKAGPPAPKLAESVTPEAKQAAAPAAPSAPPTPAASAEGVHSAKPTDPPASKPSDASAATPESPSVSQSKPTKPKS